MPIVIRRLPADGLHRFAEIDRSEEIHVHYGQLGEQLIEESVSDSVPDFFMEGEHHSIPELVTTWQPVVDAGGVLLGAFDGDVLAGWRCSDASLPRAFFKSRCCTSVVRTVGAASPAP